MTINLRERADWITPRYPEGRSRSALLPLLHLAQARDGYLSQDAIEEVAEILGLSTADVTGVASFYHMLHLKPKGRHVISICHTLACSLAGAEKVISALEAKLGVACGQSSADGEFHLERAECLAHCEIAPMIQIDYEEMVGPMTPEKAIEMLEEVKTAPVTKPPSYEAEQIVISQTQPVQEEVVPEPIPFLEEPLWVETIELSAEDEDLLKKPEERRGHRKPPAPDRLYEMPAEGPGPGPAPPPEELKEAIEGEEEEEEEPPVRPRGAED